MKADYKILVSIAGSVLFVTLGIAALFWAFHQVEVTAMSRQTTHLTIKKAHDFMSNLRDAENSQRGYLLSGEASALQTYLTVRDHLTEQLEQLYQVSTLTAAERHLGALTPLLKAKLAHLEKSIKLRQQRDMSAVNAEFRSERGTQLLESIRTEINLFVGIEEAALAQRDAAFHSKMDRLFNIIVAASLFTLGFLLAFIYLIYRDTRQRIRNITHQETQRLLEKHEEMNRQLQINNFDLQISEEKLAVTLNSIGDGVISTDSRACVTFMNPVAERLTGWSLQEAAHHPVDEVVRVIHKESRLPATLPIMETLRLGSKQSLSNHTILISRNGGECDIADSCAPIRDRDAQVIGTVLVFRNVSKEHAVQQILRNNAALIQTILNTVSDGIITLHAENTTLETVNPAAEHMFGYTSAELLGQNIRQLIPEFDSKNSGQFAVHHGTDDGTLAGEVKQEFIGLRKDGSRFPLEMVINEMWLDEQRHFTGMFRDITIRKQIEAERSRLTLALQYKNSELESAKIVAENANLAKSAFLSKMSHELRTPLNAILGFTQLLESGTPLPTAEQLVRLQQIIKAGWYLLELINEILDLAVIESGKLTLVHESISLTEILNECLAMVEAQAGKRGIQIVYHACDPHWLVNADRIRMKQVLINLLSNAIKYNREQGTITIGCSLSTPQHLCISIKDSGAGLSPDQLSQLFQPFNRLGQENRGKEGTGIGLVVTKQLIELMGGTIRVASTLDEGSEFCVELPRDPTPQAAANLTPPAATLPEAAQEKAPYVLLYIEDNPANLLLVQQIIAGHPNISLLSANDGMVGIALARAHLPDVILMDINLPGIGGIEAMTILRKDPATMHIPVIALSANAMPRDIERGLEAGFFRYLTKPIKIDELMHTLETALEPATTAQPGVL